MFLIDNCMSLIYFQGLGLIANDSAATTAETGAFMNHKPAAFLSGCTLPLRCLSLVLSRCLNKSKSLHAVLFFIAPLSFAEFKMPFFYHDGRLFQNLKLLSKTRSLCSCSFWLGSFFFLSVLSGFTRRNSFQTNDAPTRLTRCTFD